MDKRLVLIAGVAGSGKTYIGKQITELLSNYIFLDKDTMTRFLVEELLHVLQVTNLPQADTSRGPDDRESTAYLQYVRPLEYECLMKQAFENIELGLGVIATAPFWAEVNSDAWLTKASSQAEELDAKLKVVWVHTDPQTARSRLIDRGAGRDTWKLANWDRYLQMVDHDFQISYPHFRIDNSRVSVLPLSVQIERAREFIMR